MMSVEPPGANGTMTRMALLGYLSAACAAETPSAGGAGGQRDGHGQGASFIHWCVSSKIANPPVCGL